MGQCLLSTCTVLTVLLFISFKNFRYVQSFNVQRVATRVRVATSTTLHRNHNHGHGHGHGPTQIKSQLQMGIFDFFQSREEDFIKLEKTSTYGPGPILILYNVPFGIADDEIQDMIVDGMGSIKDGKAVNFIRLDSSDLELLDDDMTVSDVLKKIHTGKLTFEKRPHSTNGATTNSPSGVPILYFSGISNTQMMQTYNIIAREIYAETEGAANAACAKVVEPAMSKLFRQVMEEISGDHSDAIKAA